MKIIKPSHTYISKEGLTPYQFIEKIGRTCYKSEDNITEDSAVKFVKGLCNRKHYAMIEHFWVHMIFTGDKEDLIRALNNYAKHICDTLGDSYDLMKHIEITFAGYTYISAPLRVFMEMTELHSAPLLPPLIDEMLSCVSNEFPEIFPIQLYSYRRTRHFTLVSENKIRERFAIEFEGNVHMCDRELMKHITHTVLFICDRGVSHELVRHRPCSFAQESTRYCNYSKAKFDNEITVIEPCFWQEKDFVHYLYEEWKKQCESAEKSYFRLLDLGATPQEARSVLPNSLKTEIIMTCNEKEWQHIVNLRAKGLTGSPHPQMKEIMIPWYEKLEILSEGRIS